MQTKADACQAFLDHCVRLFNADQLDQDARILRLFAGTSEVMKIVIAKDMLGR